MSPTALDAAPTEADVNVVGAGLAGLIATFSGRTAGRAAAAAL